MINYYPPQRFACSCSRCNHVVMDNSDIAPKLLSYLQGLTVSKLFGGRCLAHHNEVTDKNGRIKTPFSGHIFEKGKLTVRAADIYPLTGVSLKDFFEQAYTVGFRRIGFYPRQGFLHVDVLPGELYWDAKDKNYQYYYKYETLPWRK